MTLPWSRAQFAWDPCPATKHGLHAWVQRPETYYDDKHVICVCSVCRASGTFTNLELARWSTLLDERLSPQRRGNGGRK